MAQIDDILKLAQERGASDLHLSPNGPPLARVNGEVVPLAGERISRDALQLMLFEIAEPRVRARFEQAKHAGFAYELPGLLRVRCSIYEQSRGIGGAFRLLPAGIPTFADLGLAESLGTLVIRPCGLVVVCGPSGTGRSCTLAALVGHLNRTLRSHIVTLEDPIEFKHPCHSSLVDQREIGRDTPSLAQGLRAALHADADVIATCEPRDTEEMETLLSAAGGCLVLVTLTASSAPHAVDAVLDLCRPERRGRAAILLADSLVAVLRQRLLPRADGTGRALALELLLNTPAAAALIREQRTAQLDTLLRNGTGDGMRSMDDAIRALEKAGVVATGGTSARDTMRSEADADEGLSQAA
jgi:twitching motility protein PilT